MKEQEMDKIADWIKKISDIIIDFKHSDNKEERIKNLAKFYSFIKNNKDLLEIKKEVKELCKKFPIYK
jgi:glycine/serine hydroxymethyltransferase